MSGVLDGLHVLDLSWGTAGPIASMMLGDYGADVVRVTPVGGDPYRAVPWSVAWGRSKRTLELDLSTDSGRTALHDLIARSDVLLESFAPGTTERLGIDYDRVHAANPSLVYCSITGYGRNGPLADRPGFDALVQARTGLQWEQPGWREGPIFFALPLPSYGAALMAAIGISAALRVREVTGRGQWVETSLLQGVLAWTTMPWTRVEHPNPNYYAGYACRDIAPTPCYATADGRWMHPMPEALPVAMEALEVGPEVLLGSPRGECAERKEFQRSVQALYNRKPRDEWLALFWDNDTRCQPVQSVEEAFDDAQLLANGVVAEVTDERVGTVRQFVHPYRLEHHTTPVPTGGKSAELDAVLASWTKPAAVDSAAAGTTLDAPLAGIRVLDFGLAVAGPYAPMLMSDLGADVVRVDNVNAPRATDDQVWASCQRGKRSITLDLKSPEGREIVTKLAATADVIHHNMRPGVAERLGIGYADVKAMNPGIVYCHVTGFGPTGPLGSFPGSDQMAQARCGLDHEQGATPNGGKPTWHRIGMCDHATAILSVVGMLQALYEREKTGEGQLVETNIMNAGTFLLSHMFLEPGEERMRALPRVDAAQTGFGPLYRLYETAEGWICIACLRPRDCDALAAALGRPELADMADFHDRTSEKQRELVTVLEDIFRSKTASDWSAILDAHGVPCEIASDTFANTWFDDPDLVANGWVAKYEHPVWGLTEQLGLLVDFSDTPGRLFGPPVMHGQHSRELLTELGYGDDEIADFTARKVTTVPQ